MTVGPQIMIPGGPLPPGAVLLSPAACGLPEPTDPQRRFLRMPTPEGLMLAGFGAGKTAISLYWAAILQAHHPLNAERTIGILAPTYKLLKETHWPRVETMLDELGRNVGWRFIRRVARSELAITLHNNTRLAFLSFQQGAARIRGFEFAACLIDEVDVELGGEYAYTEALGRVRGRGTLQMRATTTPNGYQGVTRLFAEALADPQRAHRYGVVRARSDSCPAWTKERLDSIRATMGRSDARQLLDAEVTKPGDAVFPELDRKRHVTDWWPVGSPGYYVGLDWGYSHTHFVVGVQNPVGQIVIIHEWFERETTKERAVSALELVQKTLFHGRPPLSIFPDRADPEANRLLRARFPTSRIQNASTREQQSIWEGVRKLRSLLDPADGADPRLLFHSKLEHNAGQYGVWTCFENLRRKRKVGVAIDEVAPDPNLEHGFDAGRYLVRGMSGDYPQWGVSAT